MEDRGNEFILVYCVNKAFSNAMASLRELDKEDGVSVYYYLSSVVQRIIDCYERIPLDKCGDVEKELVSGLRFVNNCLKHNPSLQFFHVDESNAMSLPIKRDGKSVEICRRWAGLEYVKLDPKYQDRSQKQRGYYDQWYKNKVIVYTLFYFIERINHKHMCLNGDMPFSDDYYIEYVLRQEWESVFTNNKGDNYKPYKN